MNWYQIRENQVSERRTTRRPCRPPGCVCGATNGVTVTPGALEGDPQPDALSDRLAVGQEVCDHGDPAPGGGEARGGLTIFEMWLRAI